MGADASVPSAARKSAWKTTVDVSQGGAKPATSKPRTDFLLALREEIQASARDREMLIQKVLSLTAQLIQQRDHKEELTAAAERLNGEAATAAERIDSLTVERDALIGERTAWAQERDTLSQALSDAQDRSRNQLAQLESDFAARLRETETRLVATAADQLLAAETASAIRLAEAEARAEAAASERDNLRQQFAEATGRLSTAEAALSDAQDMSRNQLVQLKSDFDARLRETETRLAATAADQLLAAETASAIRLAEAEARAEAAASERENLRQQFAEATERLSAVEAAFSTRLAELQENAAAIEAEQTRLQTALTAEQYVAAELRHQHEKAIESQGQTAQQLSLLQIQLDAEREARAELYRHHQQTVHEANNLQIAQSNLMARLEQADALAVEAIAAREQAHERLTEMGLAATAQREEIDRLLALILEAKNGARHFELRHEELTREYAQSSVKHEEQVAVLKLELASLEAASISKVLSAQHQRDEVQVLLAERAAELLSVAARLDAESAANQELLASTRLAEAQHKEEVAALVDALSAQSATMAHSEASAAAQIEALTTALQLEKLESQKSADHFSSLIAEMQTALARQEQSATQAEQLFAARASEIASQYSQRLREAEEALSVLDYDRIDKSESNVRLQLEIEQLRTALSASEATISAARQDAEQAQALASALAGRGLQLQNDLASELALLKEQATSERAALERAERQVAEASAGEKRLAAIVTEQDNALKSLASDYAESRRQFAGIVQALEGDLKNVMAELSARDALLASATRRAPSTPTVDEAVDLVLRHFEQSGSEFATPAMNRLAKLVAAGMPTPNVGEAAGPSGPCVAASSEVEALRHWRLDADRELQRLRADRVRIEDELDRAHQQLEIVGRSLRKSLYWRTRSKAAQIMFGQKPDKPKVRTERSTWPEE
jgi:hypothetical protein